MALPEVWVMRPKPALWVVELLETTMKGASAPVASVRRTLTVICCSPVLTSMVLGVKSKLLTTGGAVSASRADAM
ncbi:hypothetical protein GCM10027270_02700 [Nocardioides ginkgobilobae]